MQDNELLLIDAGCAYGYYADITRTFPVGGKFTPEQRLYMRLFCQLKAARSHKSNPAIPTTLFTTQPRNRGLVELGILKVKSTS